MTDPHEHRGRIHAVAFTSGGWLALLKDRAKQDRNRRIIAHDAWSFRRSLCHRDLPQRRQGWQRPDATASFVSGIGDRRASLQMRGRTDYIYSLAFSPMATLCSGSGDKTVRLWDTFPIENRYQPVGK